MKRTSNVSQLVRGRSRHCLCIRRPHESQNENVQGQFLSYTSWDLVLKKCVFGHRKRRIRLDGRPKRTCRCFHNKKKKRFRVDGASLLPYKALSNHLVNTKSKEMSLLTTWQWKVVMNNNKPGCDQRRGQRSEGRSRYGLNVLLHSCTLKEFCVVKKQFKRASILFRTRLLVSALFAPSPALLASLKIILVTNGPNLDLLCGRDI